MGLKNLSIIFENVVNTAGAGLIAACKDWGSGGECEGSANCLGWRQRGRFGIWQRFCFGIGCATNNGTRSKSGGSDPKTGMRQKRGNDVRGN